MIIMNHAFKFDPMPVISILKRLYGLDFAKGAHLNPNNVIKRFRLFHKYLKMYDESKIDFLFASYFGPSKCK